MPAGKKPAARLDRKERQIGLMLPEELALEFMAHCEKHHRRRTDEAVRAIRLLLAAESKIRAA